MTLSQQFENDLLAAVYYMRDSGQTCRRHKLIVLRIARDHETYGHAWFRMRRAVVVWDAIILGRA